MMSAIIDKLFKAREQELIAKFRDKIKEIIRRHFTEEAMKSFEKYKYAYYSLEERLLELQEELEKKLK